MDSTFPNDTPHWVQTLYDAIKHECHYRFNRIDRYKSGDHDMPLIPEFEDAEIRQLAKSSIVNLIPLILKAPTQIMAIDGWRASVKENATAVTEPDPEAPEVKALANAGKRAQEVAARQWSRWQESGMDLRFPQIVDATLSYGYSFGVAERIYDSRRGKERVNFRGLDPRKAAGLFRDPASDLAPVVALNIVTEVGPLAPGGAPEAVAEGWDEVNYYTFARDKSGNWRTLSVQPHEAGENPVTRFPCELDLCGNTMGIIEPIIPMADRLNQSVFDQLVTQRSTAFRLLTATGFKPPAKRDEHGNVMLDANGEEIPGEVRVAPRSIFMTSDPDAKLGAIPAGDISGIIAATAEAVKMLAVASQTPPHYLLGQIANLSAEALNAAEHALSRKARQLQRPLGEAAERMFRVGARLDGDEEAAEDYGAEVVWADFEARSLAAVGDTLAKLVGEVGVPRRGAWAMIPGVTDGELSKWEIWAREEDRAEAFRTEQNMRLFEGAGDATVGNGGGPTADGESVSDPS